MKRTWLLQRLEAPVAPGGLTEKMQITGTFVFGCGGHGIQEEGMKLLLPIFSFDYMGAAEYEFGAPARALHRISQEAKEFEGFKLTIPMSEVARHWREDIRSSSRIGRPPKKPRVSKELPKYEEPANIFVFCHREERTMVESTIRLLATNKYVLRDGINLPERLRPMEEHDRRIRGWLELDNGYFFFLDEEMWKKTVALFKGTDDGDIRKSDDSQCGEIKGGA